MENKLLSAALANREAYEHIFPLIEKYPALSDIGTIIFDKIAAFYSNDINASRIDKDIILAKLEREFPKHFNTLKEAIKNLEYDVSCPNVIDEYKELIRYQVGNRLSSALISGKYTEVKQLMYEYNGIENALDREEKGREIIQSPSIVQFADTLSEENLIKLYPRSLNDKIGGGALRGHHILIYARPETGKSLVSINMACGFLKQGLRVLYVGNEDPTESMIMRFTSRMTELDRMAVLHNPDDADRIAHEAGMKNLIWAGLSPGTFWEIRSLIEKYKPDILFVDQIRNINVGGEGLVNVLEKAGMEMRSIAKKYNVLSISVTQAGDSATDKLVLSMSDIDSSKTGLPATIDLMIGVGVDDRFEAEDKRMFSLTKNKISGEHGYFPVKIDRKISKVTSI